MKKIIIFLLIFTTLFTFVFTGCSNEESKQKDALYVEPTSFDETNTYIVNNGRSDYKIVIPNVATAMEKYAAEELQLFIEESTGCTISIISDAGLTPDNSAKYLSIGNTALLEAQSDIVIEYETMGMAGPTIMRRDNCVYMAGAYSTGTLYSVYKFLEYEIGFKAYADDCVYFDYFNDLKLLDFNYQYVPTVAMLSARSYNYEGLGRMYTCGTMPNKGPYSVVEGMLYDGNFCHTNMFFLSQEKYPQFYKNNQICYTNPEALLVFAENVYQSFAKNPEMDMINLGVNDYPTYCDCEECEKQTEKYGGGGVLIRFCNGVAEYIENKLKEIGQTDRKIKLVPLVYYAYIDPPVIKDNNGNYIAVDETCYPRKGNVTVEAMFTPILSCFYHSYDCCCDINAETKEQLLGWHALGYKLHAYTYAANFPGPYTFFNHYSYLSKQYKFYYDNDIRFEIEFAEEYSSDNNVFDKLSRFVHRELSWNPTKNLETVITDFMTHYYGVGSDWMETYFYALCDHIKYIYTMRGTECILPLTTITNRIYWPRNTILEYQSYILNAMKEVENASYISEDKEIYLNRLNRNLFLTKIQEYNYYSNYLTPNEKTLLENYINENIVKPEYSPN